MQPGDMVYYLYTGKDGTAIKFPARVLACEDTGLRIRVGKFDVLSRQVDTFDSVVQADKLQPRGVPCAFEDELQGQN